MPLLNSEVRQLVVDLFTLATARDKQKKIGASNLANGCDYCLASNLMGDMRQTPITNRAWGGRVVGTAIHMLLEDRMNESIATAGTMYRDAQIEKGIPLGTLGSYGEIWSTPDLVIPSEQHAFDWKGTDDKKMCILLDALQLRRGLMPNYGRKHDKVKLSEKEYDAAIIGAGYKIQGYYNQLQSYMRGLNRNGTPVTRASIVFISRTNTMWFDNPGSDRFDDETAVHGINVVSFDYNHDYAESVWGRGLGIWETLEAGTPVTDFARHELCFACGVEDRNTLAA